MKVFFYIEKSKKNAFIFKLKNISLQREKVVLYNNITRLFFSIQISKH